MGRQLGRTEVAGRRADVAHLTKVAGAHGNQAAETVGRQVRTRRRIQKHAQPAPAAVRLRVELVAHQRG